MTGMILGAAAVFVLFFLMCYLGTGTDKKNMASFYSYPDAVQEKVRENEELSRMIPKERSRSVSVLSNLILFTFVFIILGAILDLRDYWSALGYFLLVGEGLNLFDLLVIDMCWWRNTARTKFTGIPEKEPYRSMKKHVSSFLRGILVFFAAAVIAAEVLSRFPLS